MPTSLELAQTALTYIEASKIVSPMTPSGASVYAIPQYRAYYESRDSGPDFSDILAERLAASRPQKRQESALNPLHNPVAIQKLKTAIDAEATALFEALTREHGAYTTSCFSNKIRLSSSRLSSFFSYCTRSQTSSDTTRVDRAHAMADAALENKVGTSEMLASLAFQFLSGQHGDEARLELVLLENVDHVVLLIGRDPATDIQNPHSWNEDAAVCDPYTHNCYSASRFIEQMRFLAHLNIFDKPKSFACHGLVCNHKAQHECIKKLD